MPGYRDNLGWVIFAFPDGKNYQIKTEFVPVSHADEMEEELPPPAEGATLGIHQDMLLMLHEAQRLLQETDTSYKDILAWIEDAIEVIRRNK